jgi:serine-type D-Ala-D-Ala carboxypeptidase/endopeptidase
MKTLFATLFLVTSLFAYAQEDKPDKIDKISRQFISSTHQQGLIIGIIDGGNQQIYAYGETYTGSKQPPSTNSIFEIGELSSLFTTTLLARMSIEGEVDVNIPVQSLMPDQRLPVYQKLNCEPIGLGYDVYACDPYSNDETISILLCNLATHTAGFPYNPSNLKPWLHAKNPYARYRKENLYKYLNNQPVSTAYMFDYKYSHVGMTLLGHALSLKAASSYEELLADKVLNPLKLTDTRITLTADQQVRFLPGHNAAGKYISHWDFDVMAPSAGLHSTLEDMMRFLSVNMGLSEPSWIPTVKFAQNPRERVKQKELQEVQVGLGWLISPMPGTSEHITWHAGQTGGFASYIGFNSQSGIGVVILANQTTSVAPLGVQLLKTIFMNSPDRTVFTPGFIK